MKLYTVVTARTVLTRNSLRRKLDISRQEKDRKQPDEPGNASLPASGRWPKRRASNETTGHQFRSHCCLAHHESSSQQSRSSHGPKHQEFV